VSHPSFRITVDSVDGDTAVLEINGATLDVPASALPEGAAEGSVLTLALGDSADVTDDAEARLKRLKKKNPPKMSFDL